MFLYSTVSTLKPMVGIVVTISPSFSLYRIVVFPCNFKIMIDTNLISHYCCCIYSHWHLRWGSCLQRQDRPWESSCPSFQKAGWRLKRRLDPCLKCLQVKLEDFIEILDTIGMLLLQWRKIFQVTVNNHSLSENSCCCLLIKKDWNYLIMLWSQGSEKIRVFSDRLYSKQNHQVKEDSGT